MPRRLPKSSLNAGNDVIWEEDLSDEHPLRIEPRPSVRILSVEPLIEPKDDYGPGKLTVITAEQMDEVLISFIRLRPNEGAVTASFHRRGGG